MRFGGRGADIDELIHRSLCDELTAEEAARLAAWRREALTNEQQYRRAVHLNAALRRHGLGAVTARPAPSVQALLSCAREAPMRSSVRRRVNPMRRWLAAGTIVFLASASYSLLNRAASLPRSAQPLADGVGYSTGASEMATVHLSDGSVVRLAPNSQLLFVQRPTTREATLEGRAFFSVAKMPGRAFHVHTRLGDATVLGTRFELSTESSGLQLLVVSGRVRLAGAASHVEVNGGEASGVRDGRVVEPQRPPNAATMGEWVGKFLAFQSTPMHEVAREIEETYGIHVVTRDSVIASRTVTGTFIDRDVREVLDAICAVVHAQCVHRPGEVVMSKL